jgi:transcriptional regulator with XRE-family HTH domain
MPVRLGTFIRERRQDLGLTQEELAERIGDTVRQAEVSRLENNRIAMPRRERLTAVAAALDVSLGELLVRTGWMDAAEGADLNALDAAAVLEAPEAIAQVPDTEAATELETIRVALDTALTMLARTSDALGQTQEALSTLQRLVEDQRTPGPRPEVLPRIGIMDDWETTATHLSA